MPKALQLIAPTPDLIKEAEKRQTIPNPKKMEIEDSKISQVLDWALIISLVYGIPEIFKDMQGVGSGLGIYAFLGLCITLFATATYPDKAMMEEVRRPGVPLTEIVQAGKFIWIKQTKVVSWRPLSNPEKPITLKDISTQLDGTLTIMDMKAGRTIRLEDFQAIVQHATNSEMDSDHEFRFIFRDANGNVVSMRDLNNLFNHRFTIHDEEGNEIMNGRWLTPEYIDQQVEDMVEELAREELTEDGASKREPEWKQYLMPFWERRYKIIGACIAGFMIWLFQNPLLYLINWIRNSGWWIW